MSKYNDILGKDWARILKTFLISEEWQTIRAGLKKQMKSLTPMYPKIDDIFRAFSLCPYGEMTTVFLTTNPYDIQNDGLAFSSKSTDLFIDYPKVLDKIFDAVEKDVCDGLYLNREPDLARWSDQGILLLNCDLTTVKGSPGAHLKLWHPMMTHLFKFMGQHNTGINYVLIGQHAHKFERYINPKVNQIFKLEHPMIALKEKRNWNHQDVFRRINEVNKFLYNTTIDWTKTTNQWENKR